MSFFEGLQAELSKDRGRKPFFTRLFFRLLDWYDRLRARRRSG